MTAITGTATRPGTARTAGMPQAITLMVVSTMPTMALAALVPVLPAFFEHFAAVPNRETLVPMILTVPSLCVALFSAPIGALADRWGRRPVLLLALLAFAVCGTLPLLFDDLHAIIASRFVVGVAEAAVLTVGNALLGDYFAGTERQKWLGLQMSIGPFVGTGYLLAGGALGSWLWKGPFLIYLLGFVALAMAWWALHEPARTAHRSPDAAVATRTPFPWGLTALIVGVTLVVSIVYFLQAVQHGRIFSELGVSTPARISWIVSAASIGTVIGGLTFKQMRPRPVGTMLAWVFAGFGIGYVGVALAPNWVVGAPLDAVGQFAGGIAIPTLIAWALSRYPLEHRGRGMGFWGAAFFLGQFLNPPVMTAIAHGRLDFLQSTGVLGVVCFALAAIAAWRGTVAARER
ncbi:MAG: MFS transporter [Gammaproteobacteria bacterium]|nr:MFS transporter [Gammaproteobacteria bacterium]